MFARRDEELLLEEMHRDFAMEEDALTQRNPGQFSGILPPEVTSRPLKSVLFDVNRFTGPKELVNREIAMMKLILFPACGRGISYIFEVLSISFVCYLVFDYEFLAPFLLVGSVSVSRSSRSLQTSGKVHFCLCVVLYHFIWSLQLLIRVTRVCPCPFCLD